MARPRKSAALNPQPLPPHFAAWAEIVGEAIGRGVARALSASLTLPQGVSLGGAAPAARRRGRPPKALSVSSAGAKQCSVAGCNNPVRSKGMCSAHYQAARRRSLQEGQKA